MKKIVNKELINKDFIMLLALFTAAVGVIGFANPDASNAYEYEEEPYEVVEEAIEVTEPSIIEEEPAIEEVDEIIPEEEIIEEEIAIEEIVWNYEDATYYAATTLRVRSDYAFDSEIAFEIERCSEVSVIATSENCSWVMVQLDDLVGYVPANLLSVDEIVIEEVVEEVAEEATSNVTTETTESSYTYTVEIVDVPAATEPTPPPAPVINYPPEGTVDYELFVLVNDARAQNGLPLLSWDGSIAAAAATRAWETVVLPSHTRPDGSEWYTVSSLVYGENIACGQTSAQEVFNSWMNSEGHRANILDAGFRTYGSALAVCDGEYGYYWVQEFGY